jgi:hypothetical protein
MASDTVMKKSKGLKDHKKLQKEKAIANRAAVAAKRSKSKKAQHIVNKVEPYACKETTNEVLAQQSAASPTKAISDEEMASFGTVEHREEMSVAPNSVLVNHSTCKSDPRLQLLGRKTYNTSDAVLEEKSNSFLKHQSTQMAPVHIINTSSNTDANDNTGIVQNGSSLSNIPMINFASTMEIFNVDAYRKGVENELYENMESPKEWLARISHIASATVGCHHDPQDAEDDPLPEDNPIDTDSVAKHAVDDNGWQCEAFSEDAPADTPTSQISSIDQLFSMVTATGVMTVSAPRVAVSHSLEVIEEQQKTVTDDAQPPSAMEKGTTIFMTVKELFIPTDASDGTSIVCMPAGAGDARTRAVRAQALIASGQTFGCYDDLAETQATVGPSIVSCVTEKAAQDIPTRSTVQECVKALVYTCADESVEVNSPLLDPAVVGFKVKKQKGPQENVAATSDTLLRSPEFEAVLVADSEKLMATLGVGGCIPTSESASSARRSRSTSYGSSVHAHNTSPSTTAGFDTPLTPHSVSPPPLEDKDFAAKNHDNFAFNADAPAWAPNNRHNFAFNGNASTWTPDPVGNFSTPPYGLQHPGFGPHRVMHGYAMQPSFPAPVPNQTHYGQQGSHFSPYLIPSRLFHSPAVQRRGSMRY